MTLTKEILEGLIVIKINNKLKIDKILDKKGKFLKISKFQINIILQERYGKPLKVKKVIYLNQSINKKD